MRVWSGRQFVLRSMAVGTVAAPLQHGQCAGDGQGDQQIGLGGIERAGYQVFKRQHTDQGSEAG